MRSNKNAIAFGMALFFSMSLETNPAWGSGKPSAAQNPPKDRAQILLSQRLPSLNGTSLKAVLVEVRYGPGEASKPHSHRCAVVGYVVEGAIRSQVEGEPESTYKAGESFYDPPNGVHLVSANASPTTPAKFVAYFICDHDQPLSVTAPESGVKGASR
ncbi:MAG: cupin domain-containing protein [Candidatus Sulfotelmatobacter sp.]